MGPGVTVSAECPPPLGHGKTFAYRCVRKQTLDLFSEAKVAFSSFAAPAEGVRAPAPVCPDAWAVSARTDLRGSVLRTFFQSANTAVGQCSSDKVSSLFAQVSVLVPSVLIARGARGWIISVVRGTGISKQRFCVGGVSPLLSTREGPRAQLDRAPSWAVVVRPARAAAFPADVASRCVCARTRVGRGARLVRGVALLLGDEAGRPCDESWFPRAAERIRRAPHGY